MKILGTKFFGHDSAFVYIDLDRQTVVAESVERITRIKHDELDCGAGIARSGLTIDPDWVTHSYSQTRLLDDPSYEKTRAGIVSAIQERMIREVHRPEFSAQRRGLTLKPNDRVSKASLDLLEEATRVPGSTPGYTGEAASNHYGLIGGIKALMGGGDLKVRLQDHHHCHQAAAYFMSPFYGERSLVITLDGWGDGAFATATVYSEGLFRKEIGVSQLQNLGTRGAHLVLTLGTLYTAFTAGLGFTPNSDEGKVEALAAFGVLLPELFESFVAATHFDNGAILMDAPVFGPWLDAGKIRQAAQTFRPQDLAHTIQAYLEHCVVGYINSLDVPADVNSLCLAGGVAANVILNMKVWEQTRFKRLHVCPYMGDEGTALGGAILMADQLGRLDDLAFLRGDVMPYWGREFGRPDIDAAAESAVRQGLRFHAYPPGSAWHEQAAAILASHGVIAVFQGRGEFGPRALGNRSIIANPMDPQLRERLNVSIKRRPPWQPFCPIVMSECREAYFVDSFDHKYMATAFRVKPEVAASIPSAVHVDGTARPQFVSPGDNPQIHALLAAFRQRTGVGCLINTSFNLHGRAMVRSPQDALRDFVDCDLDCLFFPPYGVIYRPGSAWAEVIEGRRERINED